MKKILFLLVLSITLVSCKESEYKELEACIESAKVWEHRGCEHLEESQMYSFKKVKYSRCVLSNNKHFIVECEENGKVVVYSTDDDAKYYIRDVCGELRKDGYKDACVLLDNMIVVF